MGARWQSYAERWKAHTAGVPFTGSFLRPMVPEALAIHRRTFLGVGTNIAAYAPLHTYQAARRSLLNLGDRRVALVSPESFERFAERTGVPESTQRRRLTWLAHRGVPVRAAFRQGLLRDGVGARWYEFVWDGEEGWNAAAGAPGAKAQLRLLGDKQRSAELLAQAGVAGVPGESMGPLGTEASAGRVDVVLRRMLERWGCLHAKRRFGSRGEGACEIRLDDSGRLALRRYQHEADECEPLTWFTSQVRDHEYLLQPRLRSHPDFAAVSSSTDVVTVRLVTRIPDVRRGGRTPQVFSAVLEVPLPPAAEDQRYRMMRLDEAGRVVDRSLPYWLGPPAGVFAQGVDDLLGLQVPRWSELVNWCLAAHRVFDHVFAVAWDLAITERGPVMLEGNGGFGTDDPQWIGGGLLAGLGPSAPRGLE